LTFLSDLDDLPDPLSMRCHYRQQ